MSYLSIILATRGRPKLVVSTIERTMANIARRDTLLVVAVDEDDLDTIEALAAYRAKACLDHYSRLRVSIRPREDTLGEKFNNRLEEKWFEDPADVYLAMVDYAPHVTPGFDEKIMKAAARFPDGIGVVYNHMENLSFPQINAVTRGLVDKMGFFYPPYFPYWFIDHWLDDIARMIGPRIAVADVWIDTTQRPGTQEMREPAFWASVYDALMPMRQFCAQAIIEDPDFQETEWRKALLLSGNTPNTLVEERSTMLNSHVRTMPSGNLPHDERYQRVKAQAIELVKRLHIDMVASHKAAA